MEVYILEGKGEEGRFFMSITNKRGVKTTLFDVKDYTLHPNEQCPDGFKNIQPLKWYTSDDISNFMKEGGYGLEVYWDDLEVYRNKKPVEIMD